MGIKIIPEYPILINRRAITGSLRLNRTAHVPCQYAVRKQAAPKIKLRLDFGFRNMTKKHRKRERSAVIKGGTE
jgi:hypothetical protein